MTDDVLTTISDNALQPGAISIDVNKKDVMRFEPNGEVWFSPDLTPAEGAEAAWSVLLGFAAQYNENVRRFIALRAAEKD